ncbi:hypothetical protein C8Q74DRAFT_1223055 [Fomes fomentarius]|nr:hypothetical protein C8Q74DRAFT_1223055 [Fomes fomentarius]
MIRSEVTCIGQPEWASDREFTVARALDETDTSAASKCRQIALVPEHLIPDLNKVVARSVAILKVSSIVECLGADYVLHPRNRQQPLEFAFQLYEQAVDNVNVLHGSYIFSASKPHGDICASEPALGHCVGNGAKPPLCLLSGSCRMGLIKRVQTGRTISPTCCFVRQTLQRPTGREEPTERVTNIHPRVHDIVLLGDRIPVLLVRDVHLHLTRFPLSQSGLRLVQGHDRQLVNMFDLLEGQLEIVV